MALNGIDISGWQGDINLKEVPCDFVIVKATQGTTYVNPFFTKKANETLMFNKLLGVYHYCSSGGFQQEAKHFLNTIKPYIGKALICVDWEKDDNVNFMNDKYVKNMLDYIYSEVHIKPIIYTGKSIVRRASMKASGIPENYELWVAQYPNYEATGYQDNPWTDIKGYGGWKEPLLFQYTSNGILNGYKGHLDLDKAYMTKEEWLNRCKPDVVQVNNVTKNKLESLDKKMTVTASNALNIREKSDANSKSLGILKSGTQITVKKIENGFAYFEGWCSTKYLK